jgi:hypothetical protein
MRPLPGALGLIDTTSNSEMAVLAGGVCAKIIALVAPSNSLQSHIRILPSSPPAVIVFASPKIRMLNSVPDKAPNIPLSGAFASLPPQAADKTFNTHACDLSYVWYQGRGRSDPQERTICTRVAADIRN